MKAINLITQVVFGAGFAIVCMVLLPYSICNIVKWFIILFLLIAGIEAIKHRKEIK